MVAGREGWPFGFVGLLVACPLLTTNSPTSILCAVFLPEGKELMPGSPEQVCADSGDTQTGPTFSRSVLGAGKRAS